MFWGPCSAVFPEPVPTTLSRDARLKVVVEPPYVVDEDTESQGLLEATHPACALRGGGHEDSRPVCRLGSRPPAAPPAATTPAPRGEWSVRRVVGSVTVRDPRGTWKPGSAPAPETETRLRCGFSRGNARPPRLGWGCPAKVLPPGSSSQTEAAPVQAGWGRAPLGLGRLPARNVHAPPPPTRGWGGRCRPGPCHRGTARRQQRDAAQRCGRQQAPGVVKSPRSSGCGGGTHRGVWGRLGGRTERPITGFTAAHKTQVRGSVRATNKGESLSSHDRGSHL